MILATIKELASTDLADDDPEAVLSPNSFFVDFEKSMINAISKVFPSARINNCFFHCLQVWRRKLAQLGFKPKLEKKNKAFDPEFRDFCNFLSGIPNLNMHILTFRLKISEELENDRTFLKLNEDEKIDFLNLSLI